MDNHKKNRTKVRELPGTADRRKAVGLVYEKYFDRLFAFAYVITSCENMAKDTVSDVFLNLWASDRPLENIRELKSYLFTAVRNQAIREISNQPSNLESFSYEHVVKHVERINPEELMIGQELTDFIAQIIDALPPQCQLVYRMIREENMKYKEVADQLGISPSTVKHHLIAAVKKIRESIKEHFEETRILPISSYTATGLFFGLSFLNIFIPGVEF